VLDYMPGWTQPTKGVRTIAELPAEARAYIAKLEELTGAAVVLVSTGPGRDETIVYDAPRVGAWFGEGLIA
jgi:adenylosuccinate synthase